MSGSVAIGDLGDGRVNILWRNYGTGENSLCQMNGVTLEQAILLGSVGDLNWEISFLSYFPVGTQVG
ncbi:hypothetical protein [Mastigocladopsis repens]|uniref:hypothetical protein n=1 Tax=Mastigocladopsis repens TaxID=221287 RepID=UPI0003068AE8|nr:hypothetical protein [Mastigocladopsis repens]